MQTLEIVRSITGKNGVTIDAGTIRAFPEDKAKSLVDSGFGRPVEIPPALETQGAEFPFEEQEVDTLSGEIRSLLSGGPIPYSEIMRQLSLRSVTEDEIRAAIRDMPELIAYGNDSDMTWEIKPLEIDPVSLAERIGIRFEEEIPDTLHVRGDHPEDIEKALGEPCFIYRGHVLAWEKDPAHLKVYAWATVNLFPGRPLAVDIDSTARLLGLSPREVRESLSRLVKEGDLERTYQRGGRDLYRLIVRY